MERLAVMGHPRHGRAYEDMKNTKYKVKCHVTSLRAKFERKEIQRRDMLYKSNNPARFKVPRKKSSCDKLLVNGVPTTDPTLINDHLREHFANLCSSSRDTNALHLNVNALEMESMNNEDWILDYDILPEEVDVAIRSLKKKCCGRDGITSEHLFFAG